jgi:RNA polymerase sigma-70 factor (ECF subfamily)
MKDSNIIPLVVAAKAGDAKAFEELYKIKSKSIIFTAYGILGNYHAAEDVAQEVIVKMYRYLGKLKVPEAFDSWLYRIVINECNKSIGKKVKQAESFDAEEDLEIIEEDDIEFLPEKYMEGEANRQMVYDAVMALPKKKKQAILMFYYNQMSYQEIADAMGSTVSTVSTNILRAKQMIKESLEKQEIMGIESEKSINVMAAAPILTQVLNSCADSAVTDASLTAFHASVAAKVSGAAHSVKLKSQAQFAGAIAATTAVIVGVVAYVAVDSVPDRVIPAETPPAVIEPASPIVPVEPVKITGDISFSGGTDAEHINPKSVSLSSDNIDEIADSDNSLTWYVSPVSKDIHVIEGTGAEASGLYEKLKDAPGAYYFVFLFTDANGNISELTREFEIKD